MKTSVEKLSPTRVKISIAVPPEEFKPALDGAYKEIAGNVSVPGFRKGHVPSVIIDQRFGRGAVIEQAINSNLDSYYRTALTEQKLHPLGRPEADVAELPNVDSLDGDLLINVDVDVRPDIELPQISDLTVEVDAADVTDEDVDRELDQLRERFGTLTKVERPAKQGDFVTLDLIARIDGEEVDTASNISYQLGSGELLEGIDEALDSLTAGETTTFESTLVGGDHEGETALIEVTLHAVKERELPEADDDFAQLASEFDTIAELRESLKSEAAKHKTQEQVGQARGKLVEQLLEATDIPLPESLVDAEVKSHLEQEGKPEGDPHGDEIRPDTERGIRTQMLLDTIVEQRGIQVSQEELSQYLVQSSMQYGIEPNQFFKLVSDQGQLPAFFAEVSRSKAMQVLLGEVTVKDSNGSPVDLSEFVPPAGEQEQRQNDAAQQSGTTEGTETTPSEDAVTDIPEPKVAAVAEDADAK